MELNINSPAYFSVQYGVDDEVYRYCRSLYAFFQDKEYSETLSVIGITPVIAPKELYEQGLWKEHTKIVSLGACAIISIRMDFESYYEADSNGKTVLPGRTVMPSDHSRHNRKSVVPGTAETVSRAPGQNGFPVIPL